MNIVGKNEIYIWENLFGPFLVHELLGPRPPPPSLLMSAWQPPQNTHPPPPLEPQQVWRRASAYSSALRGGVCPVHPRCATFVLTVPTLNQDLPSPTGAPKVDQSGPQTFPTKHDAEVEIAESNINVYHSCIG